MNEQICLGNLDPWGLVSGMGTRPPVNHSRALVACALGANYINGLPRVSPHSEFNELNAHARYAHSCSTIPNLLLPAFLVDHVLVTELADKVGVLVHSGSTEVATPCASLRKANVGKSRSVPLAKAI